MSALGVHGKWASHLFGIVEEQRLSQNIQPGGGVWVDVSLRERGAIAPEGDGNLRELDTSSGQSTSFNKKGRPPLPLAP